MKVSRVSLLHSLLFWFLLSVVRVYKSNGHTVPQPQIAFSESFFHGRGLFVSQECRQGSAALETNFGIQDAQLELQSWYAAVEIQAASKLQEAPTAEAEPVEGDDGFCRNPTRDKTSCTVNFTEGPSENFQNACLNAGGVYTTIDYVYKCTSGDDKMEFFLTENGRPECYHFSCSNTDVVEELADEASDDFMTGALESLTSMECERLRLEVGDLVALESSDGNSTPEDCLQDTALLMTPVVIEVREIQRSLISLLSSSCLEETSFNGTQLECDATFSTESKSDMLLTDEYCASVLQGTYLEIDYTLQCMADVDSMVLYVSGDPYCVSRSYCGEANLEALALQKADTFLAVLQEEIPKWNNCSVTSIYMEDFSPSAAPTTTQMPSSSPAPSAQSSLSPAPLASCLDGSKLLNGTQLLQDELENIADEVYGNGTSMLCSLPTGRSEELRTASCDFDYSGLGESNLKGICEDVGGLYVEEIYTIYCEGNGTKTFLNYINKPACRYISCKAQDLKQVLAFETSWVRALGNLYVDDQAVIDDSQQCVHRNVSVYVGGNVDGEGETEISQECMEQSNQLGTTISIFNEKQKIRRAFDDYTATDLRQICASPDAGALLCEFDWNRFENQINDLCTDSNGQYLESGFETTCTKEDRTYYLRNRNVPGCLGVDCTPGQSEEYLLEIEHDWLANEYILDGWSCQTKMLDVYTPNYVRPEDRPDPPLIDVVDTDGNETISESPTPLPTPDFTTAGDSDTIGGGILVTAFEPTPAPVEKKKYGGPIAMVMLGILIFIGAVGWFLLRRARSNRFVQERSNRDFEDCSYYQQEEDDEKYTRGRSRQPRSVASREGTLPMNGNREEDSDSDESWCDEPALNGENTEIGIESRDGDVELGVESVTDDTSSSDESELEDTNYTPDAAAVAVDPEDDSSEGSSSADSHSSSESSDDISVNTEDDSPKEVV